MISIKQTKKYYPNGNIKEESNKIVYDQKTKNVNPYDSYTNSLGIPVRREPKDSNQSLPTQNIAYNPIQYTQYQYGIPEPKKMVLIDGRWIIL